MSENIKFTVSELNKILGKNYNLISFNALSSQDLLQVLTDLLVKIQHQNGTKIDVRSETPEERTFRIFSTLRVLKYQSDKELAEFRQCLMQGDPDTIRSVLHWLVTHMEIASQRAYLAQFLVKIEIPPEHLSDSEIDGIYQQYLNLLEQFKLVHKERETSKKESGTTAELKTDLLAMEKEKEVVSARIEKMKSKAEIALDLFDAAHSLRLEKDKERDYALQKEQERETMQTLQISLQSIGHELKILKKDGAEMSPSLLIQRMGEEVTVKTAIVNEKLPFELNVRRKQVGALQAIKNYSYLGPETITTLRNKLDSITREIQVLVETKVSRSETDKMEPYRQQAGAIANMKRNVLERLDKTDHVLQELQRKLQEKRAQSKHLVDEIAPRGEEMKTYINRLKTKSMSYKRCRSELAGLKAENGVLQRTIAVLETQKTQLIQAKKSSNSSEKIIFDNHSTEDLCLLNVQLCKQISVLRSKLSPILNDLQPLRLKAYSLEEKYEKAKQSHNNVEKSIQSSVANIYSETNLLKEEITKNIAEKEKLEGKIMKMKSMEERIKQEIKYYTNANIGRTNRDELNEAIAAEEKKLKTLKIEKENIKEYISKGENQMHQWLSLVSIFMCKVQCVENNKHKDGIVVRGGGAETLILQ